MKNINWEDDRDIYGRMHLLPGDKLFLRLRNAVDHCDADLTDLLTWGQLKSIRWIGEELENIMVIVMKLQEEYKVVLE